MRVLFSLPYYAPAYSYGGPVSISEKLAYGLLEKGVEVSVITTDVLDAENRNPILEETLNGVKVTRLVNLSNTLSKQRNLYAPRRIREWLKSNIKNFDLVHIHDVFAVLMTIPVIEAAIAEKIPFIVQPHGTTNDETINNSGILKPFKKRILKKNLTKYAAANAFVALSNIEKKEISKYYDFNKIDIIPNGIDFPDIENLEPMDIKSKLNLKKNTKIITYIGRLHYIKGLDITLKVLAGIKDQSDFHFIVIGPHEKNERTRLETLTKKLALGNRVTFLGAVYGMDKYRYLKSTDLFMTLSRSEGHPISVIESFVAGVPVLVSLPASLPEYEHYNVGKIVDPDNISYVQATLLYLLNHETALREMKQNSKKIITELYSREIMVDKFYKLYSRILS